MSEAISISSDKATGSKQFRETGYGTSSDGSRSEGEIPDLMTSTLSIKNLKNFSVISEVASGSAVAWFSAVFIALNKVLGLCSFLAMISEKYFTIETLTRRW